jgi:hypothetical protein
VSASPGAGAEIYKRFYPQIDVLFGNGGSTGARRTIEGLGYPVVASVELFARPLKPWGLFLSRRRSGVGRAAARLARDIFLAAAPLASTGDLRAEPIVEFRDRSLVEAEPAAGYWQTERSPELLNYFLKCPYARVTAYAVHEAERSCGYFLLADFGDEIRLVDLRARVGDWTSVIALAAQAAARTTGAYMTVSTTFEPMRAALAANRFRSIQQDPLYLYDPDGRLEKGPFHITPFDGDQAYL